MLALRRHHKSPQAFAEALGTSVRNAYQTMKRYNLPRFGWPKRTATTPKRTRYIMDAVNLLGVPGAALKFGISRQRVHSFMKNRGRRMVSLYFIPDEYPLRRAFAQVEKAAGRKRRKT